MNKKLIVWLVLSIICIEAVLGLGIRPAKTTIEFVPGAEQEYSFWIVNNDQMEMEAKIFAKGDLAGYLQFSQEVVKLSQDEKEKQITFKVKFPNKLPPGDLKTNIIIEQKVELKNNPSQFSAKLVLEHKLIVHSSYPEKYLIGDLKIEENDKTIGLVSELTNYGSQNIQSLKTTVFVSDQQEDIETLEAEEATLAPNETKEVKVELDKQKVSYGEFNILAKIFYDGYRLELEKKLVKGEPEIEILYFDRYFLAGQVNKITIDLLNKWNQKLDNLFIDIFVFKDGKKIEEIRSQNFALNGKETKKVESYLDASKKEIGNYDFEVQVNYNGKITSKKASGSILNEEEFQKQVKAGTGSNLWIYLIFGLLFAIVAGIIIFVFGPKGPGQATQSAEM